MFEKKNLSVEGLLRGEHMKGWPTLIKIGLGWEHSIRFKAERTNIWESQLKGPSGVGVTPEARPSEKSRGLSGPPKVSDKNPKLVKGIEKKE